MKKRKIDWITFFISILAGIAFGFFGEFFYQKGINKIPAFFLIGLYFFLLAAFLVFVILICAIARKDFIKHITQYKDGKGIFCFIIGMIFLTFILGTVFEFLYEFRIVKKEKTTSYIFVVDYSGSMSENDPNKQRYQAIEEIIAKQKENFPFAIYLFSSDIKLVRPMLPVSKGLDMEKIALNPGGETAIYKALKTVMKDYKERKWDGGKYPRVILLTDGEASDISSFSLKIQNLMQQYREENIRISTVGLGNFDYEILQKIAATTDGICIGVEEASDLVEGVKEAIKEENISNLLNIRQNTKDYLHFGMRVVFLFLLGILIRFTIFVANCIEEDKKRILAVSIVICFFAAVFFETAMQNKLLKENTLRILFCIFIAILPSTKEIAPKKEDMISSSNKGKQASNLEKENDFSDYLKKLK